MDEIKITIEKIFYCKLISIILQHAIQVQYYRSIQPKRAFSFVPRK